VNFSVQDVLDEVGSVFDLLLAPVNALIDEIMDALPSFDLPGKMTVISLNPV